MTALISVCQAIFFFPLQVQIAGFTQQSADRKPYPNGPERFLKIAWQTKTSYPIGYRLPFSADLLAILFADLTLPGKALVVSLAIRPDSFSTPMKVLFSKLRETIRK